MCWGRTFRIRLSNPIRLLTLETSLSILVVQVREGSSQIPRYLKLFTFSIGSKSIHFQLGLKVYIIRKGISQGRQWWYYFFTKNHHFWENHTQKHEILKIAMELFYWLKTGYKKNVTFSHFCEFLLNCFSFMLNKAIHFSFLQNLHIFDLIWHEIKKISKNSQKWENATSKWMF